MAAPVHVWRIDLDADAGTIPSLLELLSGEERVRAARFRSTEMRLRFVVAHGALRLILSHYAAAPAASLRFTAAAGGKPFIAGAPIAFSLAYAETLALCAVAAEGHIGVDVERLRPLEDGEAVVRQYFAPGERAQYEAAAPADRVATFFSAWTRKEAFVKAVGTGLQHALSSFEVEATPSAESPHLSLPAEPSVSTWHLRSFVPRPGYIAALAMDRDIQPLTFLDWSAHAAPDPGLRFSPA